MAQRIWIQVLKLRDKYLRLPGDTSQSLEGSKLWPILSKYPGPQFIVDIGANDGYHISNSYFFIGKGWSALLVEPVSKSFQRAKELHASNMKVKIENVAISSNNGRAKIFLQQTHDNNYFATLEEKSNFVTDKYVDFNKFEEVKTCTLNALLKKYRVPKKFALLSIDVEGHESEVLETLGRFRPAVILVERSLQSIAQAFRKQQILTSQEYIYAARIGCNEVYVDKNDVFIQNQIREFEKISSIGI